MKYNRLSKIPKSIFVVLPVYIVLVNWFVYYFISKERFFYYWDYANYWTIFQDFGKLLKLNPLSALIDLVVSVRKDEYNPLLVVPLQIFNIIFGPGRLSYILSLTNIYLIPALFSFIFLMVTLSNKYFRSLSNKFTVLISIIIFTLTPQILIPLLQGYTDIAGIIIIFSVLGLYFKKEPEKFSTPHLILLGTLLALLVMIRRYYFFWSLSFLLIFTLENLIYYKNFRLDDFSAHLSNLKHKVLPVLIPFTLVMILFAPGILYNAIFTDYANIYSAYRSSDGFSQIIHNLAYTVDYLGPLYFLLLICSVFFLSINTNSRRLSLFLSSQLLAIFLLFSLTQDISPHHFYLILPSVLIFFACLIFHLSGVLQNNKRNLLLVVTTLFSVISFSVVYIPNFTFYIHPFEFLLTKQRQTPLFRPDIYEIRDIIAVLDDLSQKQAGKIYVLASSGIFNDDILRQACTKFGNEQLCQNILSTNHIDKRDGYPEFIYQATYIIVADPIQYHLRPSDQTVIGMPAESLLENKGFGAGYRKLDYIFILQNNVKIYIYQKSKS